MDRHEAFCLPTGWSWPKRAVEGHGAVTWTMTWEAALTGAPPGNLAACNTSYPLPDSVSAASYKTSSVRLRAE